MKVSVKSYTAAMIDGEGTITAEFTGSTCNPIVWITQGVGHGGPLMEWLTEHWGGAYSTGGTTCYRWRPNGFKPMLKLLSKCYPFFIVKKTQARLAISVLITRNKLGRVTGFGHQNAEPPDELKSYYSLATDMIQNLNQSSNSSKRVKGNPPAETECRSLVVLGRYMTEKYLPYSTRYRMRQSTLAA